MTGSNPECGGTYLDVAGLGVDGLSVAWYELKQ